MTDYITPETPDPVVPAAVTTPTQTGPKPLTNDEHLFLNFLEQEYLLEGGIPTAASCVERNIVSETFYKKCFRKADFRHALLVRGISLRGLDGPDAGKLSEEQLVVANAILDLTDNRSKKKKLSEYKVPTQKWEAWLRDPVFQNYLRVRSESLLGDSLHESHLALVDRVRSGDLGAIKYLNEITGRYVPGANEKVDVTSILMMMVEVIERHVHDAPTLQLISDDLMLVAGGMAAMTSKTQSLPVAVNSGATRPVGILPGHVIEKVNSKVIEL